MKFGPLLKKDVKSLSKKRDIESIYTKEEIEETNRLLKVLKQELKTTQDQIARLDKLSQYEKETSTASAELASTLNDVMTDWTKKQKRDFIASTFTWHPIEGSEGADILWFTTESDEDTSGGIKRSTLHYEVQDKPNYRSDRQDDE